MRKIIVIKNIKMSSNKLSSSASHLKNLNFKEALFTVKKFAKKKRKIFAKALLIAYVNSFYTKHLLPREIKIDQIFINAGSILKRSFYRAKGTADIRKKRSAHITMVLKPYVN